MNVNDQGVICALICVRPIMIERIKQDQFRGDELISIAEKAKHEKNATVVINDDDSLTINNRLYVSNVDGLRHEIVEEAHTAQYAMI